MIRRERWLRVVVAFSAFMVAWGALESPLIGQWRYRIGFEGLPRLRGPDGDPAVTAKFTFSYDSLGRRMTWGITSRAIYSTENFRYWHESWPERGSKELFNTNIAAGHFNMDSGTSLFKSYTALLERGDVYFFNPFDNYKTAAEWNTVPFTYTYETGYKITGALRYYVSTLQSVYRTTDLGSTWQIDMDGAGGGFPYGIGVDSRRFAWLASSNGLYTQHPDSTTWIKVSTFPENSAYSIFHDRLSRAYVSTFTNVYYSTDFGTSWTPHNTGLPGEGMAGFADDAFGNVYALTAGFSSPTKIYKSVGGTGSWSRIDQPIMANTFDPRSYRIIDDIVGDTLLVVSSVWGYWVSEDQGATWYIADCGLESFIDYAFDVLPSGLRVISTSLGIHTRGPVDTTWTKRFPLTGYLGGLALYRDRANNLYTQAQRTNSSNYFSIPFTWRSTDLGINWTRDDSTGSSLVQNSFLFTVDEAGTQHTVSYGLPNLLFKKSFGLSWTPDNLGYTYRSNEIPTYLGGDNHGFTYLALATYAFAPGRPSLRGSAPAATSGGILWKQSVSGGSWVADTAGLHENAIYALTADTAGNPIVGTYGDGLYRRTGGVWSKIPPPPGMETSSAFTASVDGSNAIFAGYADLVGSNFLWRGIWFTTDLGASWTYAGLDSISIQALKSFGDTTFAVTLRDGIYRLTRNGVSGVVERGNVPTGFALDQNYPNPFNPTTVVSYSIPPSAGRDLASSEAGGGQLSVVSSVKLVVYDILGREVAVLVNEMKAPGTYQARFDGSRFASGVYFYKLVAGEFVATRKMVLLK